jgi:hypothetical protein
VNAKRRRATVSLRVHDKNDNAPAFVFNASYNRFIPRKYLAIVTELTKKGTRIFFSGIFFHYIFFWRARVCLPFLCLYHPFIIFEDVCRSKRAR